MPGMLVWRIGLGAGQMQLLTKAHPFRISVAQSCTICTVMCMFFSKAIYLTGWQKQSIVMTSFCLDKGKTFPLYLAKE